MTQTVCDCCKTVVDGPLRFTLTGVGGLTKQMAKLTPSYDRDDDTLYFDICRPCVDRFLELVGSKNHQPAVIAEPV